MDLCNRRALQDVLRQHGIRPRKHWGQNFLVSRSVLNKTIEAANITPSDTVLEVGGGAGTLTVELARNAKHVIVYERDPSLCAILRETLAEFPNVELHCADARRIDASSLPPSPYTLVANLPYSVGTIVLRRLLECKRPPKESVVMLQREVAKRIAAKPPDMNLLAVAMQTLAQPKILFRVPRRDFWPEPEVESAVVRLSPHKETDGGFASISFKNRDKIMKLAKKGFAHKRKRVFSNITRSENEQQELSEQCAVPFDARAEELTLEQWTCMAEIKAA